jgi:hypothetical protein
MRTAAINIHAVLRRQYAFGFLEMHHLTFPETVSVRI